MKDVDKMIQKIKIISRRYVAFLIDMILFALYGGILFLLSPLLAPFFSRNALQAQIIGFFLLVFPFGYYFFLCERSSAQATFGQRVMHLKVLTLQGKTISSWQSFIRAFLMIIAWELAHFVIWKAMFANWDLSAFDYALLIFVNIIFLFCICFPFFNREAKTIHDLLSKTKVVRK